MSKYQFPVTSISANETKEKKSLESGNGTFFAQCGYLQHGLTRRGYFFSAAAREIFHTDFA